jgi:hypothetical protein
MNQRECMVLPLDIILTSCSDYGLLLSVRKVPPQFFIKYLVIHCIHTYVPIAFLICMVIA